MADDATQQATQQALDPRRLGRSNSGLCDDDVSDVMCILHPGSPSAFQTVASTAQRNPQHILQNRYPAAESISSDFLTEVFLNAEDIALRFSSGLKRTENGFSFGRNPSLCDIVLFEPNSNGRRISNAHFLIKPNSSGILVLEDISTNGTIVDDITLCGRKKGMSNTHILQNGSIIQIVSPNPEHKIIFHVRIPPRDGFEPEYRRKFADFMRRVNLADTERPNDADPVQLIIPSASYGMRWDGRPTYSVTGFLGKGAFAQVYQLTTRKEGKLFAVKELEKRRYVKDGILDRKISNEMEIMKSIKHPHIVQYVDYHDIEHHLYIVMEYVPYGDFQQFLKKGSCAENIGVAVARQTLHALDYLHANKITHRDIKPDNILIASIDPFIIKLSDFGLSKVKKDETFLKTFCGTLLYCAPEVFPHFQAEKTGSKRRHSSKSYSYTHAVDIWSLAGVLWFALSGDPPFEGVVDQTGRGMFDKIMHTPLNTAGLQKRNISLDGQDLLKRMLTTDPEGRPTARQCLRSKWLDDGSLLPDYTADLNMIAEESDEAEEQFSQMSLRDIPSRDNGNIAALELIEERSFDDYEEVDEQDFGASRSKRVKTDARYPRNQIRNNSEPESSAEPDPPTIEGSKPPGKFTERRLFGEIGASALEDSGVLGQEAQAALHRDPRELLTEPDSVPINRVLVPGTQDQIHDPGILETESLVREFNMVSPHPSDSYSESPESSINSYNKAEIQDSQMLSLSSEETPKAAMQSKFESMDATPTRNSRPPLLPETANVSAASMSQPLDLASRTPKPVPADIEAEWKVTSPKYGTLITTMDSTLSNFHPLNDRWITYGRNSASKIRHPDPLDSRVSRASFVIVFNASNIEAIETAQHDWTGLQDLHVLIYNYSRTAHLWVNDVELPVLTEEQIGYTTRLYSGDVITVFQPTEGQGNEYLRFVCDFYVGTAKQKRAGPVELEMTWNRSPKDGTMTLVRR
jgi:serine/threonine protein kinase